MKSSTYFRLPCAAGVLAGALAAAYPCATQAQSAVAPKAAHPGSVTLRAVVFSPADAQAAPAPDGTQGVVLVDLGEADVDGARDVAAAALGRPITPELVQALVAAVNARLAQGRNAFAIVTVPDQDVTQGVLRLWLWKGRLGHLDWRAGTAANPQDWGLVAGQPLDAARLGDHLAWLDHSLPGRRSTVQAEPGKAPGTVDLRVQVEAPPPWSVTTGVDNAGSKVSGNDRLSLGAQHVGVFATDDVLGAHLGTDSELQHLVSLQADYTVPLPWEHLLSLSASSSRLKGRVPDPLDMKGRDDALAVRYEVPLRLTGAWTDSLVGAFEFKRSDNNLLFSDTPVTNTLTRIGQFSLSYQAAESDALGRGQGTLGWVESPGGLFGANDDAAFDAVRAGATARYRIVRLQIDRQTALGPVLWHAALNGQWANANLLGSEQVGAGGAASVRGFNESSAFGDRGWVLRNELRPASPSSATDRLQWTPLLFVDAADLHAHVAAPGEPPAHRLASAGLGVEASWKRHLSMTLQWGQRVRSDLASQPEGGGRLHASLQWTWP